MPIKTQTIAQRDLFDLIAYPKELSDEIFAITPEVEEAIRILDLILDRATPALAAAEKHSAEVQERLSKMGIDDGVQSSVSDLMLFTSPATPLKDLLFEIMNRTQVLAEGHNIEQWAEVHTGTGAES